MPSPFYVHLTVDGAIFVVRADGTQAWLTQAQLVNELRSVTAAGDALLLYSRADDPDDPAPIVEATANRMAATVSLPIRLLPEPHPSVAKPLGEGATMLMAFAMRGRLGLVDDLLLRGADVDHRDASGATALLYAANGGHEPVVQALVDHGADVDAADDEGNVALMFAAQSGHERVVARLLQCGADPGRRGEHGYSALGFARELGHDAVAEVLERAGAPG